MDRTKNVPEVKQVDRDAAADWFYEPSEPNSEAFCVNIREACDDGNSLVQAFARHRTEATRPLTAEIADLRAQLDEAMEALEDMRFSTPDDDYQLGWTEAVDAILTILAKRKQQ